MRHNEGVEKPVPEALPGHGVIFFHGTIWSDGGALSTAPVIHPVGRLLLPVSFIPRSGRGVEGAHRPRPHLAYPPGYPRGPHLRNDFSISHEELPEKRHSQNTQPLTGLPVMATAAADGDANCFPFTTSAPDSTLPKIGWPL